MNPIRVGATSGVRMVPRQPCVAATVGAAALPGAGATTVRRPQVEAALTRLAQRRPPQRRKVASRAGATAAAFGVVTAGSAARRGAALAARPRVAQARAKGASSAAVAAGGGTGAPSVVDSFLYAKVGELVAGNPIMVFSKSTCPFCAKAKAALKETNVAFQILELDTIDAGVAAEIQDILGEITGAATVPRVFVGGKCIGGGDDAARLAASGVLKELAVDAKENHLRSLRGVGEFPLSKTDDEWKSMLDPQKYRILRQRGTEMPGSHPYDEFLPEAGHFACAGCGLPLYSAQSKFASSCGWPVFDKCFRSKDVGQHVAGRPDGSGSLEIICSRCGSHLGHVFYDAMSNSNKNGERH